MSTPYDGLGADRILDAMEHAGYAPTGSLLGLNSYENRVYQIEVEDGDFKVAKFYRPERWSRAQILEEHAFTEELARAELPVVVPERYGDDAATAAVAVRQRLALPAV